MPDATDNPQFDNLVRVIETLQRRIRSDRATIRGSEIRTRTALYPAGDGSAVECSHAATLAQDGNPVGVGALLLFLGYDWATVDTKLWIEGLHIL